MVIPAYGRVEPLKYTLKSAARALREAGGGFGEEVGAEHESAIYEWNRGGDMLRVAVLLLYRAEKRGLLGRQDDGEIAGGLVADGLGNEVGECHIAATRSVMRVETRESRRERFKFAPIE